MFFFLVNYFQIVVTKSRNDLQWPTMANAKDLQSKRKTKSIRQYFITVVSCIVSLVRRGSYTFRHCKHSVGCNESFTSFALLLFNCRRYGYRRCLSWKWLDCGKVACSVSIKPLYLDRRTIKEQCLLTCFCLSTLLSKPKIPRQLARGKPRLNLCACPFKTARINYTEFIHSYK